MVLRISYSKKEENKDIPKARLKPSRSHPLSLSFSHPRRLRRLRCLRRSRHPRHRGGGGEDGGMVVDVDQH